MRDFTVLRETRFGSRAGSTSSAPCVVTIPVRNEAAGIVRCLDALHRMDRCAGALNEVQLVLNGCTDATSPTVQDWACAHDLPVAMIEVRLAAQANHAGGARAVALRLALRSLRGHADGVVLTTDADTRVPRDWLERALAGVASGCDVIAGDVDVEPAALDIWSASLRRRVQLEDRYAVLLDEVDALCDPVPHNPWPTHRRCSGANLVFRAHALRLLPRLPSPACGEDRALVAACLARDMRVRHDPAVRVETSARLHGRAQGGMADTLRARKSHAEMPCDPLLEAFVVHVRRATWRAAVRKMFRPGMSDRQLADAVGLAFRARDTYTCRYFGEAWQRLERLCPALRRDAISPVALPLEIEHARSWLAGYRGEPWSEEAAA